MSVLAPAGIFTHRLATFTTVPSHLIPSLVALISLRQGKSAALTPQWLRPSPNLLGQLLRIQATLALHAQEASSRRQLLHRMSVRSPVSDRDDVEDAEGDDDAQSNGAPHSASPRSSEGKDSLTQASLCFGVEVIRTDASLGLHLNVRDGCLRVPASGDRAHGWQDSWCAVSPDVKVYGKTLCIRRCVER